MHTDDNPFEQGTDRYEIWEILVGRPTPGLPGKHVPEGASQHVTAGPYSPVLHVRGGFVVISGQVAVQEDGSIVSTEFTAQAIATLRNCETQLATAGCTLADVFKTNVYLADLANWAAFNAVYEELVPVPRPVRTAIGAVLLPGILVEVEMWATGPAPHGATA